jgi:hypothetical protein
VKTRKSSSLFVRNCFKDSVYFIIYKVFVLRAGLGFSSFVAALVVVAGKHLVKKPKVEGAAVFTTERAR